MLARRDYSRYEIAQKLKNKSFEESDIHAVVNKMAEDGLINEQRFIESFIRWRTQRGYGPLRIAQELQARGITPDMIAEQLEITDNAWFAEARKIWQKHFKGKLPSDFKLKAKQMRFLQSRGFTREQIESVFGNDDFN